MWVGYDHGRFILILFGTLVLTACDDNRDDTPDLVVQCHGCGARCYEDHIDDYPLNQYVQRARLLGDRLNAGAARIDASIARLRETWDASNLTALRAAVFDDVAVHASAGLLTHVYRSRCHSEVDATPHYFAWCADETCWSTDLGPDLETRVEVVCRGRCDGACYDGCSEEQACASPREGETCDSECTGTCETGDGADCSGQCFGTCSGNCSSFDIEGNCAGFCDGTCSGDCVIDRAASCSGLCWGSCLLETNSCSGGKRVCTGVCEAECDGNCLGPVEVTGPTGDCELAPYCTELTTLFSLSETRCSGGEVVLSYVYDGPLEERVDFASRMSLLETEMAAVSHEVIQLRALIDGESDGEVVYDLPAVPATTLALEAIIEEGVEGRLVSQMPLDSLPCVLPTLQANYSRLDDSEDGAVAALQSATEVLEGFTAGFAP